MNKCAEFLPQADLFKLFSPGKMKDIADAMMVQDFHKGDYLIREGVIPRNIYIIIKGKNHFIKKIQLRSFPFRHRVNFRSK